MVGMARPRVNTTHRGDANAGVKGSRPRTWPFYAFEAQRDTTLLRYLTPTPRSTTACTFATVCSKNTGSASVLPVSACTCTAKSA